VLEVEDVVCEELELELLEEELLEEPDRTTA
jgi:hypothetical protein